MDALSGDTAAARLEYIVRDHDREKFEARKELLRGVEKAMLCCIFAARLAPTNVLMFCEQMGMK